MAVEPRLRHSISDGYLGLTVVYTVREPEPVLPIGSGKVILHIPALPYWQHVPLSNLNTNTNPNRSHHPINPANLNRKLSFTLLAYRRVSVAADRIQNDETFTLRARPCRSALYSV